MFNTGDKFYKYIMKRGYRYERRRSRERSARTRR